MIKFLDSIKLIASRAGQETTQKDKNGLSVEEVLKQIFNLRYKDFSARHRWPWLNKTFSFQTIPNYKEGNVFVTIGSRTVSNSGTATFTDAMKGRFFKLDSDVEMYEILDVPNSQTLTLKEKYVGQNNSGSYLIWKRYYDLPCDCKFGSKIILWQYPYRSHSLPLGDVNLALSKGYTAGFPKYWGWSKLNRKESTYSVGTIGGSKGTKTLTGSGTLWIEALSEGCEIVIDSYVYNVDSIDSDTQVTLVQNIVEDLSGKTYKAKIKNNPQIVFSSVPNPPFNFNLDYPKKVYDLLNDEDTLEIWEGYEHIVIDAVLFEYLDKLTSDRALNWFKVYEAELDRAWSELCNENPSEYAIVERDVENTGYRKSLYS